MLLIVFFKAGLGDHTLLENSPGSLSYNTTLSIKSLAED